jgi:hypothetical protein
VKFQLSDRVKIDDGRGAKLTGTVTRVWNKPAKDPYVTVRTDDGRTFVRCSSVTAKQA